MARFVQVANEGGAHLQADQLRWQIANEKTVTILRRGKDRKTFATISPTCNAELWPSWEPIVREWLAERANGQRRTDHAKFASGKVPK